MNTRDKSSAVFVIIVTDFQQVFCNWLLDKLFSQLLQLLFNYNFVSDLIKFFFATLSTTKSGRSLKKTQRGVAFFAKKFNAPRARFLPNYSIFELFLNYF